jgi:hypothetical protein
MSMAYWIGQYIVAKAKNLLRPVEYAPRETSVVPVFVQEHCAPNPHLQIHIDLLLFVAQP